MENWVITAGSTNFYNNLLTSFIASLRETAGWNGNIGVMNYGLTPHEAWTLRQNGIEVIPPSMKYAALIDDRFTTIADFFSGKKVRVATWDADMWFCQPINEIFYLLKPNQLACTYDSTFQGFMNACVKEDMQPIVGECISRIREDITHVLQGGFIAGDADAWTHFSGYQDSLIELGICTDSFGVDMVALNLMKYFWPDRVQVLGVEWNCLPEWGIRKEGEHFTCSETEHPLKAIHVTSPNRNQPYYKYEQYYPEEFQKWRGILGG